MSFDSVRVIAKTFFRKKRIYTGATFLYTPILIIMLLICKGVYFNIDKKQKEILKKIADERSIQSQLALQFAKNQNHKKILDLKERYFPHYVNIGSEDIILESEIETLGKANANKEGNLFNI